METLAPYAMSALLAWASGLRLYLVVFCLGMLARFGVIALPVDLAFLANHWVLGSAAFLAAAEFFADKIPGFDSLWDAIHTFVRIPAGMGLAAAAMGFDQATAAAVAGLLGGAITSGTHLTKAGMRAMINTSPEPISNWAASFGEEGMVVSGIWFALYYPVLFLILLALFLVLVVYLLPKLWRAVRSVLRFAR